MLSSVLPFFFFSASHIVDVYPATQCSIDDIPKCIPSIFICCRHLGCFQFGLFQILLL